MKYLLLLVVVSICLCCNRNEYPNDEKLNKIIKQELKSGIRYDSLPLGFYLGMSKIEAEKHKEKLKAKGCFLYCNNFHCGCNENIISPDYNEIDYFANITLDINFQDDTLKSLTLLYLPSKQNLINDNEFVFSTLKYYNIKSFKPFPKYYWDINLYENNKELFKYIAIIGNRSISIQVDSIGGEIEYCDLSRL